MATTTTTTLARQTTTTAALRPAQSVAELPLIGCLPGFNRDRLGLLLGLARACGPVARFHFGPFPAYFFNAPELIQAVLVDHAHDFDGGPVRHNAFGPIIGQGLFNSEGELHRRQRKIMAPAFQPRHIQGYADTMVAYGERIQAGWQPGAVVDVCHEMTTLTMSIIGKVLFDAEVMTEADAMGRDVTTVLGHIAYVFSTFLPAPLSWPLPRHQRTRRAIAALRVGIQRMIDERRNDLDDQEAMAERDDFLSILLRARDDDGTPMSDEQVIDEAMTFFGAGHETTANGLTWAWYLLAQHPAAYARLRAEVDSVLGGRAPTYADLPRLPYSLRIFKESLRLYPPAYVFSRFALRDVAVGGYPIRKGETVIMSPYTMHRRPDLFANPGRFDPDRFTPEREAALPRHAYMPFGAGPRICIGNHFALMEGHLLLATLAQRVTFELAPGQHVVPAPQVTTRPRDGIQMIVRRRQA
jgi:cytochrome P450